MQSTGPILCLASWTAAVCLGSAPAHGPAHADPALDGPGAVPPASAQRPPRYGDVVSHVDGAGARIALTFDDGPRPPYTGQILDVLRNQGVKATFFLIGENVRRYPELARRIVREGHAVGNHTMSHRSLPSLDSHTMRGEIAAADRIIRSATGIRPRILRPPYGAMDRRLTGGRGVAAMERHLLVTWSIEVRDWSGRSPRSIAVETLRRVRTGSIVLLHDGGGDRAHVVTATRWMLGHLAGRGFEMVTVPELLSAAQRH